ncbi:hypothetical protein POJ06DRAFT_252093, partial [Lipomyces tetrasporus]
AIFVLLSLTFVPQCSSLKLDVTGLTPNHAGSDWLAIVLPHLERNTCSWARQLWIACCRKMPRFWLPPRNCGSVSSKCVKLADQRDFY